MTTKSFLYKSFATLALLAVTATNAIGQIRDTYEDVTVQHLLKNKWYQMRENAGLHGLHALLLKYVRARSIISL